MKNSSTNPSLQREIESICDRIHNWCKSDGRWVSADGRVSQETAAEILGITPASLRNRQCVGQRIRFHRASARGRVSYNLRDLAEYIAINFHD